MLSAWRRPMKPLLVAFVLTAVADAADKPAGLVVLDRR